MTEQRVVFGEVAQQYDDARPSYPDEIFDIAMSFGGLAAGDDALEIGGGTGKATQGFLARGLKCTRSSRAPAWPRCYGARASTSRRRRSRTGRFANGEFRLVYAAQAWHWVHGADRYERLAGMLRPAASSRFLERGAPASRPFKTDNDAVYAALWPARRQIPVTDWRWISRSRSSQQSPSFEPSSSAWSRGRRRIRAWSGCDSSRPIRTIACFPTRARATAQRRRRGDRHHGGPPRRLRHPALPGEASVSSVFDAH